MAFTPQEIDIIKQVKEQGGTMQQAEAVIAKVRAGSLNTVATKPAEKEGFSFKSTFDPFVNVAKGVESGARKFGADLHKMQTGYFDEMAQGKTPSTGTNLGFVGKTAQSIIKKEADFSKRKAEQGDIGQTSIEKGLDQVSGGLSIFNSIIGQGVNSIASIPATEQQKADAKMVGQKIASSDVGQAVGRTIGDLELGAKEFERQNPRIGSQLRNVGTLAETVGNLAGTGFAKKGATSVAEKAGASVKELPELTGKTQAFKDFVSGKITDAKNIGKVEGVENIPSIEVPKVGGSFSDRLKSGLSKEQIAGYQANPAQKAEVEKLYKRLDSPEGIADIKDYKVERVGAVTKELTDEIDKIRTTKGETGEVYNAIKASDVKIEVPPLLNDIASTLKKSGMEIKDGNIVRMPGSAAKDLNAGDVAKFDTLYKDILADAQKGYLTPKEILSFRSTASSLSKYDAGTTTTGQGIMKAVRKNIDKTAKEKVPGLKELDAKFQDKIEELEDAIQDLVYKGGDVKGEWRSNIVSIIGTLDKANRAKLLARLEEVTPGIGEKIKAIDNIPGIAKAIQDKGKLDKFVGIGGALSGATIGATLGPGGAVIGFLLGFAGGKMLDAGITGIRKKAILKILSKMSPEGIKKLERIKDKIKKKLLLTKAEKQELERLKATFKKETTPKPRLLLPAGKKPPIVTPQTAEKAVITESKKGIENTKFGERANTMSQAETYDFAKQLITDTNNVKGLEELKNSILKEGLAKGEELIEEIENKIAGIKSMEVLDEVGDIAKKEYGEDLFSSFKKLFSSENRTIKTKSGDKYTDIENQRTPQAREFNENAKEYLAENPWIDKSVQEVYEDMKDLVKKQVSKQPLKLKPTEIKTTLSSLNKSNIDSIASKITSDAKLLPKVKEVIQEHIAKYGEQFKEYMADLVDKLADVLGSRSKLLGKEGIGRDKTTLLKGSDDIPKTAKIYIKSKFSDKGGYKDVPIIGEVKNKTLYQGSSPGEKRQFWTTDKDYAKQFGEVKEKTGDFYKVDNGNRVIDVYIEKPTKGIESKPLLKGSDDLISEEGKSLIYKYTKSGGGTSKPMGISEQKQLSKEIVKLPKNKETVYSGLKLSTDDLYDLKNDKWTTKRVLSTSTDRKTAEEFADYNPEMKNKVILTINGGGHNISKYSAFQKQKMFSDENEILFPVGQKFKVEEIGDLEFELTPIYEQAKPKLLKKTKT